MVALGHDSGKPAQIDSPTEQLIPSQRWLRLTVLLVLLATGLGMRLYGITEPPTEFHPMRQYRGAIISRDWFVQLHPDSYPAWQVAVAAESARKQSAIEPLIMEGLAATFYNLVGSEQLWIPRALSALFWMIGTFFLYRLVSDMLSPDAGLAASAYFALQPFGVLAGRSFQPDPLMLMLMIISLERMWQYFKSPSLRNLILASLLAGLAILVKPMCLFVLVFAFLLMQFQRGTGWQSLFNRSSFSFSIILIAPIIVYYAPNILMPGGNLQSNARSIMPALLMQRFYWTGWLIQINKVIGLPVFLAAILGFFLSNSPRVLAFQASLWAGYLVMGLVFTYHIHTHDYYSLILIPVAAISLSSLVAPVMQSLALRFPDPVYRTILTIVLLLLLAAFSLFENKWLQATQNFYAHIDSQSPEQFEQIGEIVHHSTRVISLSDDDMYALGYHGWLGGSTWPPAGEFAASRLGGATFPPVDIYFDQVKDSIDAEYFVVVNLRLLAEQPELQALLASRGYPVITDTPYYRVYSLKKTTSP